MVLSVIVIPALIMRILTEKLKRMLVGSVVVGAVVGVLSVTASRYDPNQCGAMITLGLGGLYCLVLGYDMIRSRSLLSRSS